MRYLLLAAVIIFALPAHADIAAKAERYVGLREGTATLNRLIKINTRRVRWCAGFVRAMFNDPPTDSLAVRDWQRVGYAVMVPKRNDLAFWRHSHMGLVVAVKGDQVCTVSGNRGNKVARSCEPRRKFRRFRRIQ